MVDLAYYVTNLLIFTEGAYRKLRGRWRILSRKCESQKESVKSGFGVFRFTLLYHDRKTFVYNIVS